MSYTTRCPACGTTFRVVPDQLKISDGWVRCGHCADVFDATLYLEKWTPPIPEVRPEPEPEPAISGTLVEQPSEQVPAPEVQDVLADPGAFDVPVETSAAGAIADDNEAAHGMADGEWLVRPGEVAVDVQSVEPAGPATEEPPSSVGPTVEAPEDFHADLARFAGQTPRPVIETPIQPSLMREEPPQAFTEPDAVLENMAVDSAVEEEPGFVRQARRQAFWRSSGVRAALLLLAVLLLLLLALQWGVNDRDRLAARHPALAPWLERLCDPLGCEIAPPRELEAVVIDSSTLARRLGSFYAFDVVLKNTSDMAVAVPALELSLTDTGDRVIARRVFLPAELPGAPAALPAHESVSLNLRLSIQDVGPLSMAGYRALVFYP